MSQHRPINVDRFTELSFYLSKAVEAVVVDKAGKSAFLLFSDLDVAQKAYQLTAGANDIDQEIYDIPLPYHAQPLKRKTPYHYALEVPWGEVENRQFSNLMSSIIQEEKIPRIELDFDHDRQAFSKMDSFSRELFLRPFAAKIAGVAVPKQMKGVSYLLFPAEETSSVLRLAELLGEEAAAKPSKENVREAPEIESIIAQQGYALFTSGQHYVVMAKPAPGNLVETILERVSAIKTPSTEVESAEDVPMQQIEAFSRKLTNDRLTKLMIKGK